MADNDRKTSRNDSKTTEKCQEIGRVMISIRVHSKGWVFGLGTQKVTTEMAVDLKLTEVSTGKIILADTVDGAVQEGSSFSIGGIQSVQSSADPFADVQRVVAAKISEAIAVIDFVNVTLSILPSRGLPSACSIGAVPSPFFSSVNLCPRLICGDSLFISPTSRSTTWQRASNVKSRLHRPRSATQLGDCW